MKITFESFMIYKPFIKSLEALTDIAEVCTEDIRYDSVNGIVEMPMKRREIIEKPRKGCLGLIWLQPSYTWGQNWIDSLLIIRKVVSMTMEVDDILVVENNSCFTVKMGVKIEPNEVYLGSLEEVRGKTLCEISIAVEGIDIELVDQG